MSICNVAEVFIAFVHKNKQEPKSYISKHKQST
jgi:hypothetical protein